MMAQLLAGMGALLLLAATGVADKVVMRDGSEFVGTVTGRDERTVRLRTEREGFRLVISIPRKEIDYIQKGPIPAATRPAVIADVAKPAATRAATKPAATAPSRFFAEMLAAAVGQRPDLGNPDALPPEKHELWSKVVAADREMDKPALVKSLTALANAMPEHALRLDMLAQRYCGKPYGQWLAEARWDLIAKKYRGGIFDLKDATEIETPALIAILRAETPKAVDPVKTYFPAPPPPVPPGPRTGPLPKPAKPPDPLASITPANALEVRDKAAYASAVLAAQLRLEPNMPLIDRVFLSQQLGYVRRALTRANDLEPQARALQERQERERRLAEERARREAAKQRLLAHPG